MQYFSFPTREVQSGVVQTHASQSCRFRVSAISESGLGICSAALAVGPDCLRLKFVCGLILAGVA